MTRPHTERHGHQSGVSQVDRGSRWAGGWEGGGLAGHSDGPHSWKNLKPAGDIFSRYGWSGRWDGLEVSQRSTNCWAGG